MHIRQIAAFSALPLVLAALGGCQQKDTPTPEASAGAAAMAPMGAMTGEAMGPDAKPGTSAQAGRLVLPVIPGRPAGVYFRFTNTGTAPVELVGVHIEGASEAQMHETRGGTMASVKSLPVAPGATITFAPGGYHVMAFGLDKSLKSGGTTEMTLTFAGGDKLSLPLTIETMGKGMPSGSEPIMDHGSMDHGSMDHGSMEGMHT
ncbi:copper chaperone PCu(A)C [Novosphingobium sp. 1949]|uniref:Copper chaperone PCu(A)C n=1 Tax=Novosphingobium organovorum TaxID=2930092 RepID=A0ABT0BA26_9SPHN|nr:copper chaperone PCu(A)C [Novosphingobium organovorum]MCJ2181892.1 copper chaperone PCu(A)C [Novosphingobium organovorum]